MENRDLLERLLIAQIMSCDCGTKTPETKYHNQSCRYRVLSDAADAIQKLMDENARLREALEVAKNKANSAQVACEMSSNPYNLGLVYKFSEIATICEKSIDKC